MGAEQEDVARHRLHRPVLVHGSDERVIGFGDDSVVTDLGDRAARCERGQARALAAADLAVDGVVVDIGAASPAARLDAVGHEVDDLVELLPGQVGERGRPADQLEEVSGAPLLCGGFGDDLLSGDVERQSGELDAVQSTGTYGGEERRALDQLVASQWIEPPLRGAGPAVVRPSHALEERGDAAGGADLADELDGTDVDAQLERRRRDQRLQVTGAQAGLDPMPPFFRQAAVVRGDDVVTEALRQEMREAFGEPSGVDEDERGAVLLDELGDAVEDVGHLLGGGDGFELAVGQLERQVEVALVARVDDGRQRTITDEQARDSFDGTLGRREPDPGRAFVADGLQPFECDGEVGAALIASDGVDLVDDDGLDGVEPLTAFRARHEEVERFGGGDYEVRRLAQHRGALRARRVTGADRDAQVRGGEAELGSDVGDLGEGSLQVLGDVDRERFER